MTCFFLDIHTFVSHQSIHSTYLSRICYLFCYLFAANKEIYLLLVLMLLFILLSLHNVNSNIVRTYLWDCNYPNYFITTFIAAIICSVFIILVILYVAIVPNVIWNENQRISGNNRCFIAFCFRLSFSFVYS